MERAKPQRDAWAAFAFASPVFSDPDVEVPAAQVSEVGPRGWIPAVIRGESLRRPKTVRATSSKKAFRVLALQA